jgi:putative FmdB family regulatory protein
VTQALRRAGLRLPYNEGMPIFEYVCSDCDRRFEAFVQGTRQPHCPACDGVHLQKQLSVFAVAGRADGPALPMGGACGTCGDPRGPGSCSLN